jgi:hypothetical protein
MERPVPQAIYTLHDDASRVFPEIRGSFAGVLGSLSSPVRRPRDITRVLGLHRTLAWKIMQVVDAEDPLAIAPYIPGAEGINIFLSAAERCDAPPDVINRARAAMADFEKLIAEHVGDRASLELMLGATARKNRPQIDLAYRKAGFQCGSYTWGVQARTRLLCAILYPDQDPLRVRAAKIAGFVNLRRVRRETPWTLWRTTNIDNEDGTSLNNAFVPIDPADALPRGVPLLQPFSTVPSSQIERVVLPDSTEERWVPGSVGDKFAITCITGEVLRKSMPRYRTQQESRHEFGQQACTPVEVLVQDVVVHHGLYGRVAPDFSIYSELAGRTWYDCPPELLQDQRIAAFPTQVEYLGRGADALATSDVPQYPEILRYAFGKLGWETEACDMYRIRMEYPVLSTATVLSFEMPAPPPNPAT